ncbi:MAG: 30S ribosomal protein S12 methylthiotransferase RimO [Bacteroidia bacterium]|nr:30S ribosomal protein S12 methylthiotransferase RimO [Bacteroidia bacterium]
MRTKSYHKRKINIITLGCSKNIVDSEQLMGELNHLGCEVEHEGNKKKYDVVIINTCGFIENAKKESIQTILNFVEAKKKNEIEKLYVTGCLSERYKNELQKEIPEVDAYFGTKDLPLIIKQFKTDYQRELTGERILTTPLHYAYLKISEGCDRPCSFCAIPLMRGSHVSVPIETLVEQAKKLADKGVKELLLIAQDLTYYGLDIYRQRKLANLLEELSKVNGIEWIRLHYLFPSGFPEDVLYAVRDIPQVCKYLDMPIQHINNEVLKNMKRGITKEKTNELIFKIREMIPNVALRTSVMVGFPGETEEQFNELLEWLNNIKFDRLGVFTYSHEENTTAYSLKDTVPSKVKQQRANEIMLQQQKISYELNQKKIGNQYKIIIDKKEGKHWIGRTEYDSPDVDNEVIVQTNEKLEPGNFYFVKITDAEEFDLYAQLLQK